MALSSLLSLILSVVLCLIAASQAVLADNDNATRLDIANWNDYRSQINTVNLLMNKTSQTDFFKNIVKKTQVPDLYYEQTIAIGGFHRTFGILYRSQNISTLDTIRLNPVAITGNHSLQLGGSFSDFNMTVNVYIQVLEGDSKNINMPPVTPKPPTSATRALETGAFPSRLRLPTVNTEGEDAEVEPQAQIILRQWRGDRKLYGQFSVRLETAMQELSFMSILDVQILECRKSGWWNLILCRISSSFDFVKALVTGKGVDYALGRIVSARLTTLKIAFERMLSLGVGPVKGGKGLTQMVINAGTNLAKGIVNNFGPAHKAFENGLSDSFLLMINNFIGGFSSKFYHKEL